MKNLFVALFIFATFALAVSGDKTCKNIPTFAEKYCQLEADNSPGAFTSRYGGIAVIESEIEVFISAQLRKSFDYLLMATNFDSYEMHRPGFKKLFKGLSDRCFDDAIDLIKHLTLRGGYLNDTFVDGSGDGKVEFPDLNLSELNSIKLALENEKFLANGSMHLHYKAMHSNESLTDPEFADYVEKRFLRKQADSVRLLSGYANDLLSMEETQDREMGLYLYDEFLCGTECEKRGLHG